MTLVLYRSNSGCRLLHRQFQQSSAITVSFASRVLLNNGGAVVKPGGNNTFCQSMNGMARHLSFSNNALLLTMCTWTGHTSHLSLPWGVAEGDGRSLVHLDATCHRRRVRLDKHLTGRLLELPVGLSQPLIVHVLLFNVCSSSMHRTRAFCARLSAACKHLHRLGLG